MACVGKNLKDHQAPALLLHAGPPASKSNTRPGMLVLKKKINKLVIRNSANIRHCKAVSLWSFGEIRCLKVQRGGDHKLLVALGK